MTNPNTTSALNSSFVEHSEYFLRGVTTADLVATDDGRGTPEWRRWIERQKRKRRKR